MTEEKKKEFLARNKQLEMLHKVPDDHVIISKEEYEAVITAFAYGRIKVVNEQVVSNVSFRHEIGNKVNEVNKLIEDKENPPPRIAYTIVGRIDWDGFEDDYLLINSLVNWEAMESKEVAIQLPESQIEKIK